uniref:Translation initiation factor 2 subunit alpha n=1 Tax=uncultured marine thaumarchaeote SAT1000_48_A08 TaxID=1456414 RepID=A0A075IFZ2_9ARCH|nr:RNA-binding S1 domain-containing protein [uncultured marine thaumarchaeote SAT1000_48_A08]|tara:strand:+ start:1809 stop:2612 length:804 start_codon:yes stop_codon:yes gene_type:complete
MSTETQELPEIGEIVIATITKVSDHGAYVTLDEYDGVQGFLHISEIAPGWVRKVRRYVKENEKKVLLVKKIQAKRGEIDLSLKQISKEQRKKKLLDVKRFEKEQGILKNIQEKAELSTKQIEDIEDKLLSKYDSIYDAIIDIATKNKDILNNLEISEKIQTVIEDISSKIKLPSVEIRGILELTNNKSNGIEIIKKILLDVIKDNADSKIEISYIGAPKYRVSIIAQEFKTAEKIIKPILEKIEKDVKKQNGTFNFTREESKKTGGG